MPAPAPKLVRLRPLAQDDLPTLFQHQLDPEANRVAVANPRDQHAFDAHWDKILADPNVVARAITLDDLLVGNISCFRADDLDNVGYWIDRAHWARGIATRALALLLEEVTTRPLHARTATSNTGSLRVLQRCGFEVISTRTSPRTDRFPACEEHLLRLV